MGSSEEVNDVISKTMERLYDRMMRGFAKEMRAIIEPHFSEETAQPGSWMSAIPSSGHCVVASMMMYVFLGTRCTFVSKEIHGQSHWWVRGEAEYAGAEMDVTADQFGGSPVLVEARDGLREGSKVRSLEEIDWETRSRFLLFFSRVTGLDYEEAQLHILSQ